jgi:hypothetical protein
VRGHELHRLLNVAPPVWAVRCSVHGATTHRLPSATTGQTPDM